MNTAEAIVRTLQSPNVADRNLEAANVVDVLSYLAISTNAIAKAITPQGVGAGRDETGGRVESLTEAVMGISAGLFEVSHSISDLAEAVRERNHS